MASRNYQAMPRRNREGVSNPNCVLVLADYSTVRQGTKGAGLFSHKASADHAPERRPIVYWVKVQLLRDVTSEHVQRR